MKTKSATNVFAKECIVTALKVLMKEKPYREITISEITIKAGVSRMAYYRNYTSKEDIIRRTLNEKAQYIDQFTIPLFESGDMLGYIEYLFTDFQRIADFYQAIVEAQLGDMILKHFSASTFRFIAHYCDPAPIKYQITALSGACYNMAITWILDGMRETPRQMAEIFLSTVDLRIITHEINLDVYSRRSGPVSSKT